MSRGGRAFLDESVGYLRDTYVPRIRTALETLPQEELWRRRHDGMNTVGNLLVHLEGNVRQWILSGLAGASDHRERAREFAAREGGTARELLAVLESTVGEACAVIAGLDVERLQDPVRIQGVDSTPQDAIYHVVEHFAWHAGQIVWVAKERAGPDHGIAFYDDAVVNAARNEPRSPDGT